MDSISFSRLGSFCLSKSNSLFSHDIAFLLSRRIR